MRALIRPPIHGYMVCIKATLLSNLNLSFNQQFQINWYVESDGNSCVNMSLFQPLWNKQQHFLRTRNTEEIAIIRSRIGIFVKVQQWIHDRKDKLSFERKFKNEYRRFDSHHAFVNTQNVFLLNPLLTLLASPTCKHSQGIGKLTTSQKRIPRCT